MTASCPSTAPEIIPSARSPWRGALLAAFLAACSSQSGAPCVPGQSSACACPNNGSGVKICLADRTFAPCACGDPGADLAASADLTPQRRRAFATSASFNGALGGLAGADGRCQSAADAALLGGTFKAWLSTATVNAIDRFTDSGPWYAVDQTTRLFNNRAGLATLPLAPINRDENGRLISGVSGSAVLTGTKVGGTSSGHHCAGWTSAALMSDSTYGFAIDGDNGWTEFAAGDCSSVGRLYCLQQ